MTLFFNFKYKALLPVNTVRMYTGLLGIFLLFCFGPAIAQLNLGNPIPKSINVDLANLNGKEYKDRFKQYKDTIKFLGKLEKQTLVKAKKVFKELPVEEKHKVKLKNLERDVLDYRAKIGEIDSLQDLKSRLKNVKISSYFDDEELAKAEAMVTEARKGYDQIIGWLKEHQEAFQFSDSSLSLNQKMTELMAGDQVDQLPWDEIGVDSSAYLASYNEYSQYLGEGKGMLQGFKSDSTQSGNMDQITQLTDQYFGSYENYQLGKEKLVEVEGLLGKAKEYREGIEAILRGDLEKVDEFVNALQARAMKIEAMRKAADELGELESYEQDIRNQIDEMRYKADLQSEYEKHIKGKDAGSLVSEALMKGKELGGEHFEGHEDLLASAQEGLSKIKAGSFNFGNSDNMEVIKPNSLEGKGLGERLVIGGNLQIARQEEYTGIDFSPVLGYRWNKRYMWGIGGTFRAKVNEDEHSLIKDEQVYGGRFYMEYSIGKFFLHGEYELMSNAIANPTTQEVRRVDAPGAMLGVGINYSFMKKIKGNVMVLYNFLHEPGTSPYDKPILFRFGFNLDK